jgi:glycosyltransferase EpsH
VSKKLSIIIPVYNAERTVRGALDGALAQTYGNIEVICVDDGSTDGTSALLDEKAAADPRLTVIRQGHGGAGAARNRGLDAATGDYVLFLDADDALEPYAAETLMQRVVDANADLAAFGYRLAMPPDACPSVLPAELSSRFCRGLWDRVFGRPDEGVAERLFQLGAGIHNSVYRTAFIRGAGLRFTGSVLGETIPFASGALIHAERIALVRRELATIGWWHGGGLVQRQLGSPDRYCGALAALKAQLEGEGLYDELRRSFVNYAVSVLADEIEAQREYPAFTQAAHRLRLSGFDGLDLLGHPDDFYYEAGRYAVLRGVVLGAYYSDAEQEVIDLKKDRVRLRRRVSWLRVRIGALSGKVAAQAGKLKRLGRRGAGSGDESARALLRRLAGKVLRRLTGKRRRAEVAAVDSRLRGNDNTGGAGNPLNFSTGVRFKAICDSILALDDGTLCGNAAVIAAALTAHRDGITKFRIYGEERISDSNKTYRAFLGELTGVLAAAPGVTSAPAGAGEPELTLTSATAAGIRQSIEDIRARAAERSEEKCHAVYYVQEGQVFPTVESLHLATVHDARYRQTVVFSPVGDQDHKLKNLDADISNSEGRIETLKRDEFSMFGASPDMLIVTRPYFNAQSATFTPGEEDVFEIPGPEVAGFRPVYVPYAFYDDISDYSLFSGYQHHMHAVAWKIIAFSPHILSNFRKYAVHGDSNVALLGAPRFDVSSGINPYRENGATELFRRKIAGRRTLLWNTHFTNPGKGWAAFLDYLEGVIAFFEGRDDLVLFFRPHPLMFDRLVQDDILTGRDVRALEERFERSGNMILDRTNDYINSFALSDAMLTDGASSLPYEYIATGKPVYQHYILGGDREATDKAYAGAIRSLYYASYGMDELVALLGEWASGEDPRRDERAARAPEFIYQCDGHIGERVKDYLYDALIEDETRLGASIVVNAVEEGYANIAGAGSRDCAGLLASALDETPAGDRQSVTCLAVLSNTYLLSRGGWRGVVSALGALNGKTPLAHIIHLGNLTGGDCGYAELQTRVAGATADLSSVGKAELLYTMGDLDADAAGEGPLSVREQSRLYLGRNLPRGFTDIKDRHLRLITLDSYDADKDEPAGYGAECLAWLGYVLADMPPARRAVIFSHMPPSARLAPGAGVMRGEEDLAALLAEYAGRVLCHVCGHGDADYIDNDGVVPVVCCSGADAAGFDAVAVDPVNDTVRFLRAGSGRSRIVEGGEARWL